MTRNDFVVVENDDAERYEFRSLIANHCSYFVDYAECSGYLERAWQAVEKSIAAGR